MRVSFIFKSLECGDKFSLRVGLAIVSKKEAIVIDEAFYITFVYITFVIK